MFFTKDPNRFIRDKGHLGYIISAMMFAVDALGSNRGQVLSLYKVIMSTFISGQGNSFGHLCFNSVCV